MIDEPNKEPNTPVLEDDDFEYFYSKIYDEFGEKPQSEEDYLKNLMSEKPEKAQEQADQHKNDYANPQKKAAPVKKDHSIRNLTILIVLELLGIVGVAVWWILQLL